ncbi:MAG: biotin transporter BioY [bacterium]
MPLSTHQGRVRYQNYLMSSLFAALTAAGAFLRIPLTFYVPITLQTFFVILAGSVLGAKFGAISQIIYLTVGLLGAPIFAHGGGPGYVFQPTFGYLVGYPIAAYAIGYMIWGKNDSNRSNLPGFLRICFSNLMGVLIIFVFGVTVLYLNIKMIVGKPITLGTALWGGFVIFIPGDIIKILLSSFITVKLYRILQALKHF